MLELEVVRAVLAGKLACIANSLVADAQVLAMLLVTDGTQVGGEAGTAVNGRFEPRTGVGVECGGRDLHEVDLRLGEFDLAHLVEPTIDILLETP